MEADISPCEMGYNSKNREFRISKFLENKLKFRS